MKKLKRNSLNSFFLEFLKQKLYFLWQESSLKKCCFFNDTVCIKNENFNSLIELFIIDIFHNTFDRFNHWLNLLYNVFIIFEIESWNTLFWTVQRPRFRRRGVIQKLFRSENILDLSYYLFLKLMRQSESEREKEKIIYI